eukprot:TRINITY_DN1525_c0_g2_i1.p1 TRINITY_DN1525_c0_g2~~TRINITY_DN1525_c0_g2_i1.p1  ORF type:complete len:918 (-),score=157.82 TRINITY_DN1525_c0_g2_i1:155-2908(-)
MVMSLCRCINLAFTLAVVVAGSATTSGDFSTCKTGDANDKVDGRMALLQRKVSSTQNLSTDSELDPEADGSSNSTSNKDPTEETISLAQEAEEADPKFTACKTRFQLLDRINSQDLTKHVGNDPLFPASAVSAGGEECVGAKAKTAKCTKFNNWMTIQMSEAIKAIEARGAIIFRKPSFISEDVRVVSLAEANGHCHPFYTELEGPKTAHCHRVFSYSNGTNMTDETCKSQCSDIIECQYASFWKIDGKGHCTLSRECGKKNHKKHVVQVFKKKCVQPSSQANVLNGSVDEEDIGEEPSSDSYIFAGLWAIAHTHPEVIDAMFVDRPLWKKNVFKTKWFYHGKEVIVSVDNMLPASKLNGHPFFGQFSRKDEAWPMIIEKAWAKMHQSYAEIATGAQLDFMSALTSAPVEFVYHGSDTKDSRHVSTDLLWKKLLNATRDGFAITASTKDRDIKERHSKLVKGHEYAVLKAGNHGGKRSVMVANPTAKDSYKGHHSAYKSTDKRIFWMTLEEYDKAFGHTSICKIFKDYTLISVPIKPEKDKVINLEVNSAKPFWVSLSKPTGHQMDNYLKAGGCKKEWYDFDLKVDVTRNPLLHQARAVGGSRWGLGHIVSAEVGDRPKDKTWLIKASAKSKAKNKQSLADNLYVTIYAPAGVELSPAPLSGLPTMSSVQTGSEPSKCVDGSSATICQTNKNVNPWFQLDLKGYFDISKVKLVNRKGKCASRLFSSSSGCDWEYSPKTYDGANTGAEIGVSNTSCTGAKCSGTVCQKLTRPAETFTHSGDHTYTIDCGGKKGRFVYVTLPRSSGSSLNIAEFEVYKSLKVANLTPSQSSTPNAKKLAGVKVCETLRQNTNDKEGGKNQLRVVYAVSSAKACGNLCSSNKKCTYFIYHKGQKICHLKKGVGTPKKDPNGFTFGSCTKQ